MTIPGPSGKSVFPEMRVSSCLDLRLAEICGVCILEKKMIHKDITAIAA